MLSPKSASSSPSRTAICWQLAGRGGIAALPAVLFTSISMRGLSGQLGVTMRVSVTDWLLRAKELRRPHSADRSHAYSSRVLTGGTIVAVLAVVVKRNCGSRASRSRAGRSTTATRPLVCETACAKHPTNPSEQILSEKMEIDDSWQLICLHLSQNNQRQVVFINNVACILTWTPPTGWSGMHDCNEHVAI